MFTTTVEVKEMTGYDVSQEVVIMAQNIIETFVGRDEVDIIVPNDRSILAKATAYQAAYMRDDSERIFEQAATVQLMQGGNMVTFTQDGVSPWIAPLAAIACKRLSWKRSRSIRTGSLLGNRSVEKGWTRE